MSLKGRGQGVDLGTSTLSLIRSIICSLFGRDFPYDPLNLFPFFVFLSPRPHTIGPVTPPKEAQGVSVDAPLINHRAATVHRFITLAPPLAILFFAVCLLLSLWFTRTIQWQKLYGLGPLLDKYTTPRLLTIPPIFTTFRHGRNCRSWNS